ncbi:MAG TPA: hypothetical protein VNZ52_16210 [Candidatus Thermoplasmatota archaeon]|nr:hypothetical protein [Candidatus Thermoplasmatota archaeon]
MEKLAVATWRIPKAEVQDVERASTLAGSEEALARFLRDTHGIQEFILLSTCQRVLLTYVAPPGTPSPDAVLSAAFALVKPGFPAPVAPPEAFQGFGAFEHLAEVTASLDSLVPGEAQILGQMKAAYQEAEARGHVGKPLRRTFSLIFKAAKRIRSDTALFRGKVSLLPLTVEFLEARMQGLERAEVAVVGTGEFGQRVLDMLRNYPQVHLHLVSRELTRAAELGSAYRATPHDLAAFLQSPPRLDILVLCSRADEPLVTVADAARLAVASASSRPLLIVDLAMPRNAEEAVRDVPGVALVQLDELATISERNKADRHKELKTARDLLHRELEAARVALQKPQEKPVILDIQEEMQAAAEERLRAAREMLAAKGIDVDSPEFQFWYQQAVKHFTHVALSHTKRRLRAPEGRDAA